MKGEVHMPSLLVPRSEGNWGAAYDVLVAPKINIIMNKVYVQTYNGGSVPIEYRLRISDESTGQVIYDISSTEEVADNNRVSVSPNIWKDFQDLKMFGGKTYRLSLTTITQDSSTTDFGTHGSRDPFNGLSNEHLTVTKAERKYGKSALQFPDWKFDYTVEKSGIFVRGSSSSFGKTIARPAGVQEGDIMIIHTQHYNDASVASASGFTLLKKTPYSSMFYRVATKDEPSAYAMSIITNKPDWILAGIVVIANAEFASYNMLDAAGSPVTVSLSKNFAVVAGINGNQIPLTPYTQQYNQSTVSIVPANTKVEISKAGWDTETKYVILTEKTTTPPTKPSSFTKQPVASSVNLSCESVSLEWGTSTSASGGIISYSLEFFNRTTWSILSSNIATSSYVFALPKLNADKAQFRVKSIDSKGGQSEYTTSNIFSIAILLLLVKDGDMVKTYKNGDWQVI